MERTVAVLVMEIRFALVYADLHERFWGRVDSFVSGFNIVAGVLAMAGAFTEKDKIWKAVGVVIATMGGIQLWIKPLERSIAFRDVRRELHDLNGKAWGMPQPEVEQKLEEILGRAPRGWDVFSRPAQNRAWAENGYERPFELNLWEKLVCLLA